MCIFSLSSNGKSIKNRIKDRVHVYTTDAKNPVVNQLALVNHLYLYSLDCSQQPSHPSTVSVAKRLIDIVGAIVGLVITFIIAIIVAIITFIYDPSPIFYSQIRCGLNGKPFRIWKFRSMIVDADQLKHLVKNQAKGHIFKSVDDPRITPLGKFLRGTSLDEFPQFWNVLVGEMSLVGTRPPTFDEVKHYDRHHWDRLRVKPGITGEWQANGRSSITDFETIVKMDLDYQRKWSVNYDLSLILKTIWVVFKKTGAY